MGLQELKKSRVLQQTASYCEQIIKETASTSFNLFAVREKAFWQISSKLDEFLAMEEYVHKENEILKHHEMRIRAKWLRYTMEVVCAALPGRTLGRDKNDEEFSRYSWRNARLRRMDSRVFQNSLKKSKGRCQTFPENEQSGN